MLSYGPNIIAFNFSHNYYPLTTGCIQLYIKNNSQYSFLDMNNDIQLKKTDKPDLCKITLNTLFLYMVLL